MSETMERSRSQMVENEMRSSWLIVKGRLQGKWKEYTAGMSRKSSKMKPNIGSKCGSIEGSDDGTLQR